MLDGLGQINYQKAVKELCVQQENSRYEQEQLCLSMVMLSAWGVSRISHINDQPVEEWGVVLDSPRRPDGDTLNQYLNQIIELDEKESEETVAQRLGQIRPDGMIDRAQQSSLYYWTEANLTNGDMWYFDDHVIEYSGQARIGKTKHGTKNNSVKSVNRYTLHNGDCSLSEYFPVTISYAEAMRQLVSKANSCLPLNNRICKLSFDRAGWNAELLHWLQEKQPEKQEIMPITWVKRTNSNVKRLNGINDEEFVPTDNIEMPFGKKGKQQIVNVADTMLDFPDLGCQRVVVLETESEKRVGIYTTALHPGDAPLSDRRGMSTVSLIDTMRYKQRIENRFKVEKREMDSDALPGQKTHQVTLTEPYDLDEAQKQLDSAQQRVEKYANEEQQQLELLETDKLNKHQFNLLHKRAQRLGNKAKQEIETLSQERERVQHDQNGQSVLATKTEVLDIRKLTLLNLFKLHALAALNILARRLGLPGAGPERLRRSFLAFGDRVEFDHDRQIATVYARPFPRAQMQQAYEKLCSELYDVPIMLTRNDVNYRVRFSW